VTDELFDITGRARSPVTLSSFRQGQKPPNAGEIYQPLLLSPQDVERVLAACLNNPAGIRDRAIIAVLYRTGLATAEVIDLLQEDIDLTPGAEVIVVRTGRLLHRNVALDAATLKLIQPWIELRPRYPNGYAFCIVQGPTKGGRWSESALRTKTRDYGKSLGWDRLVPSDFRYSFIADLIVEQWPVPYIQAQLGVTTMIAFEAIFRHLGIEIPDNEEVGAIIRSRHWPLGGSAP
jgi:integrase